jgi:hypothetical protein
MTAREVHQLKETTRVTLEAVARLADGDDLRRAGLPAKPSTYPAMHTCSVVTNDLWVTKRLDGGWVAAYRLVVQDGAFVVGELRIHPDEGSTYSSPGVWSGIWKGLDAQVPAGGLTATLAREGAKMQSSLTEGRGILRSLNKQTDEGLLKELQEDHGLATLTEPKKPGYSTSGRLGKPHAYYRRVAKEYSRALRQNSRHPNQDVALTLGLDSVSKARDAVYRARRMGLLPPTQRGRAKS